MDYIKKNLNKIILIIFVFILPVVSFADSSQPINSNIQIVNPLGSTSTINDLIRVLLQGVIKIGIPIITLAIIYSGFLFVSAQGNSEKLGEAKRALIYTLIGAAILLGSWAIAQLITNTVIAL
jgi:hypothetical protein